MNGSKGETVSSAAKRIKWNGRSPDIITNCELFNMKTYKPSSSVVDNGKVHLLTETYGFGFKNYKTPIFSYKNNVNAEDFVGAYPVLINNGKKGYSSVPSGLGGNRARTCIGYNNNNFSIAVVPEKTNNTDATLDDMYNLFTSKGYTYAINLDGGGSTAYATKPNLLLQSWQ